MEREIQHVAQLVAFLGIAIAGQKRRIDMIFRRELREERIVLREPTRAVQEEQRQAAAGFEIAHGDMRGVNGLELHGDPLNARR